LGFRSLSGDQLFGDLQLHTLHSAENRFPGQTNSRKSSRQAVAGCRRPKLGSVNMGEGLLK
jgi:hypothetical protein